MKEKLVLTAFGSMAGDVVKWTFCLASTFVAYWQFCVPNWKSRTPI